VEGWNPMVWMDPIGNSGWDNSIQTLRNAMMEQLNCSSEGACNAACVSMNCDPVANTVTAHIATYLNVEEMHQYGAADILIIPKWGGGATQGGNLYNTAAAYAALTPSLHPFLQLLPNCGHVCDTYTNASPSEIDAMNFLLKTAQTTSGGLSGSSFGSF
jgi:hypothetical protein